jgi:enamine deaminase RidA (YjgF/YER057c/UK114 family)
MTTGIYTRVVESPAAAEIYVSAWPDQSLPLHDQAHALFTAVKNELSAKNARILHERIFASADVADVLCCARATAYGKLDDGVAPTILVGREQPDRPIAGLHLHAVNAEADIQVIRADQKPCGRILTTPGSIVLTLSAITDKTTPQPADQARAVFEKAESILKPHDADFLSVARTWMWLGDILAWYDDFNHVRNTFFTERGLIGPGTRQSMPASTGIGLALAGPPGRADCAMDLFAVLEPKGSTHYLQALGKQQCALEYGSAFSRAAKARTPAGQTLFVSGTASIDAAGRTTNLGDPAGQIITTIENVRAVLHDVGLGDNDVVHVVAYCKTPQVEQVFNNLKTSVPWPWLTVACDICRDDLLFEIEATAASPHI